MDASDVKLILESVHSGQTSVSKALERLKYLPFEDLGFAKIDHHRELRQGFSEVVYGQGKTPEHVAGIIRAMLGKRKTGNILITRADARTYTVVRRLYPRAKFHKLSRAISIQRCKTILGKGTILVVTAGTSDIPVAEEAIVTAQTLGNRVEFIYDVGVAGLHRLLRYQEQLANARVVICVAGMEGALPGVVGGLVAAPVIAVPTSTGYGASFGGLTALLSMLNSCSSNVTVVNIDNGFGAACVASTINRV
jgi:pyridinium-3,5-biscarboxylic acid mononucleotide synthase